MPKYEEIKERSQQIYERNRAFFLKERDLYSKIAELILTPLEEPDSNWKPGGMWPDDTKTAITLAIARMFNNFEASQNAILHGLAEQAHMPIRDAIECMMLTRLFRLDPTKANDWLYRLKLYPADHVKKWIEEAGENSPEYLFYDFFSKRSYANIIGSAYRLIEKTNEEGALETRTIHFGADPNNVVAATAYAFLLAMMYCAVRVVLPLVYVPFISDPRAWEEQTTALGPELQTLDPRFWQMSTQPESVTEDKLNDWEQDLIRRKSGHKTLEKRLKPILEQGAENGSV